MGFKKKKSECRKETCDENIDGNATPRIKMKTVFVNEKNKDRKYLISEANCLSKDENVNDYEEYSTASYDYREQGEKIPQNHQKQRPGCF